MFCGLNAILRLARRSGVGITPTVYQVGGFSPIELSKPPLGGDSFRQWLTKLGLIIVTPPCVWSPAHTGGEVITSKVYDCLEGVGHLSGR